MGRLRRILGNADGPDENEEESETPDFVRRYDLTEVDWSDHWERIYMDRQDKAKLINYGLLEQRGCHRIVLIP
jgi:hypothetical protein